MDQDYVKQAEQVISRLKKDKKDNYWLTTSQMRNILSLTAEIFNIVNLRQNDEQLQDDLVTKLYDLKVRIIYQSGRKQGRYYAVQDFEKEAELLNEIEKITTNNELLRFCKYMEALVAYKKFYDRNEK